MAERSDVQSAVDDAHRREWSRVLGATMRVTRDFDLAEECVQEAYALALVTWTHDGVPSNPAAWLTTVARRRAVDVLRRETMSRSKLPLLMNLDEGQDGESMMNGAETNSAELPDERLRLIFMCCHPALAIDAQLALTLRLVCGLSTEDVARLLVVTPSTMSARMTRAKRKIALTRIKVAVPPASELPDRLRIVVAVIYLLFTGGYSAPTGETLVRRELTEESLRLARLLADLMPDEADVAGLLALMLVSDARRTERLDPTGNARRFEDQDRSRWDWTEIDEARELLSSARRRGRPGRYVLQAAIGLAYVDAPTFEETNWSQILALYDELLTAWPSPVVELNRSVAVAHLDGAAVALFEVERLEGDERLSTYHYLFAVKAEFLRELGRWDDAAEACRIAIDLTTNDVERRYLFARLGEDSATIST